VLLQVIRQPAERESIPTIPYPPDVTHITQNAQQHDFTSTTNETLFDELLFK